MAGDAWGGSWGSSWALSWNGAAVVQPGRTAQIIAPKDCPRLQRQKTQPKRPEALQTARTG